MEGPEFSPVPDFQGSSAGEPIGKKFSSTEASTPNLAKKQEVDEHNAAQTAEIEDLRCERLPETFDK